MTRRFASRTLAGAVAIATLGGTASAVAQGIEEVVVTAQKRQESSQDDHPVYSINFGELGPITEQYAAPRTYGLDVRYEY